MIASEAAYHLSYYDTAREYALIAMEHAEDPEDSAHAVHLLGAALAFYDPAEAEEVLTELLSRNDSDYVQLHKPAILTSLAWAYERRRDALAITVYRQAAQAYLAQGRPERAVSPLQNAAWLALLAGELDEGHGLLNDAGEYLSEAGTDERTHQEALEAYALLQSGERYAAICRAEELLHPGRRDTTPWAQTLAAIVAAEVALHEGLYDYAAGLTAWAGERAQAAGCTKLSNLLGDLRRRVRESGVRCGAS
nr:MAG: hypothetical protein DIU70_09580 [Bacillota bacterium]